jgi:hypothetical protein
VRVLLRALLVSPAKEAQAARARYRWDALQATRANDKTAADAALKRFAEVLRKLGLKDAS